MLKTNHLVGFAAGVQLASVDAADFDGTNDLMNRGALSGAADSQLAILSAWARLDGGDGTSMTLFNGDDGVTNFKFQLRRFSSNLFEVRVIDTAAGFWMIGQTIATYVASATWLHILASWNASERHLYIRDVSDKNPLPSGGLGTAADLTAANWGIGAFASGGGNKFNGALAELYFAPGQFLDFSVEANRRKFISASLKPAFLGANGSMPTGTIPLVYHHLSKSEPVANFAINRGSGGNFTITGTLDTASTSPSD